MSTSATRQYKLTWLALASLGYGISGLLLSFFAEYVQGLVPCQLCLVQRWILLGLVGVSLLEFVADPAFNRWAIRAVLLAMIGVASYHFAIQMGWVSDPCKLPSQSISSINDFKQLLQTKQPCSQAALTVLEVPASIINAFLSLSLLCVSFINLHQKTSKANLALKICKSGTKKDNC